MPGAVDPLLLRLERDERVEEVRHPEAAVDPAPEVAGHRRQVGRVVREQRGELGDRLHDHLDVPARDRVVGGLGDRAVLDLQGLQRGGRRLEPQPRGARLDRADVLDDLRLADPLRRLQWRGHVFLLAVVTEIFRSTG